jgi:hypothetical protein
MYDKKMNDGYSGRTGPTTTAAATQPPAGHHHGAVTAGPWQAVTSACPLRARPQRLKISVTRLSHRRFDFFIAPL